MLAQPFMDQRVFFMAPPYSHLPSKACVWEKHRRNLKNPFSYILFTPAIWRLLNCLSTISLRKNSLSVPQQPKNEACGMKSICKRMGTLIASVSGRFPVLEGRVEERMILGYGLTYTSIRSRLLHGLPQPVLL